MYLGKAFVPLNKPNKGKKTQVWGLYECTICSRVFKDILKKRFQPNHYHDRDCYKLGIKKGGPSYKKMITTNLERWGVTCTVHNPKIHEEITQGYLDRWGVDHQFKAKEVRDKRRVTNLERYGNEEFTGSAAAKERIDYKAINAKKIQTEIKNGTTWKSAAEYEFLDTLKTLFGEVTHQAYVHRWPIDFYVSSIDAYVQFDGVYWHGLDRPLEKIIASEKPRDIAIYKKYCNDIVQNDWFLTNNITLLRFTDKEYVTCKKSADYIKTLLELKIKKIT